MDRVPLVGGLPVRPEEGLCDDLGAQVHGEWKVEPGLAGTQRHERFEFAWKAGTFFESETMRVFVRENGRTLALEPTEAPYRKSIQVQWPVPSSVTVWEGAWSILPGDTLPSDRWLAVQRKEGGEVARAVVASWLDEAWEVDLPRGGEWTLERDTVPPRVLPYHSGTVRSWLQATRCGLSTMPFLESKTWSCASKVNGLEWFGTPNETC